MTTYPEFYSNNASTTLASTAQGGDSTINVVSVSGFPTNPQFRILVDSEIMIVTGLSGTTWTVTRGAEGTMAGVHSANAPVYQIITSGSLPRCTTMNYAWGTREYGRPYVSYGEYDSVASGATITLLDTSVSNPNTPGYIDHFWVGTLNSPSYRAHEISTISFYRDGESSPSLSLYNGNMYLSPWFGANGAAFDGGLCGLTTLGSLDAGGYIAHKIPFSSSMKVTLTNGDTGTAKFFWDISYKLTPTFNINWGRAARLLCSSYYNTSVTPYAEQQIANVTGRGLIYGWQNVWLGGDNNLQYLEGDIQIYIDGEGSPSLKWSGTEDYFLNAGYFSGGLTSNSPGNGIMVTPYHGCASKGKANGATGVNQVSAYRFHVDDPIPFDQSFRFTWFCGDASEATVTNPVAIYGALWYYLDT